MKLTEDAITSPFIGKTIKDDLPKYIFPHKGNRLCVYSVDYQDEAYYQKEFGITGTLLDHWLFRGIHLNLYIDLNDREIETISVSKFWENCCGHFRSTTHRLKPTQQELRIIRRILNYIT